MSKAWPKVHCTHDMCYAYVRLTLAWDIHKVHRRSANAEAEILLTYDVVNEVFNCSYSEDYRQRYCCSDRL